MYQPKRAYIKRARSVNRRADLDEQQGGLDDALPVRVVIVYPIIARIGEMTKCYFRLLRHSSDDTYNL